MVFVYVAREIRLIKAIDRLSNPTPYAVVATIIIQRLYYYTRIYTSSIR